jgi:O-antigen/teichoic acid export membrane protein
MRLARTSVVYFLSDTVTSVLGFLATVYFARTLGSDILGKYFLVVALISWLSVPTNGIKSAITKRVSEGTDQGSLLVAGFILNSLIAGVVAVATLLFGSQINSYIGADVSHLFPILFAGQVLFGFVQAGLSGQHMVANAGVLKTFDRLIRVIVQVYLVFAGYQVTALVGGEAVAVLLSAIVGLLWFRIEFEMPSIAHFKHLLNYGKYSWLGHLKGKAFVWMDTIVLSLFVGPGLIAVYEIAWRLSSVLILVSVAVGQTLFPEMSKVAADGNEEELLELLEEGLFAAGLFVIPGLFGALVLGEKILEIYGSEFIQGGLVLIILIIARGIDAYGTQFETLINAFDRPDLMFRVNAVFVATNVVLNLLLVYFIGWVGAAVATATSSIVITLLSYHYVSELLERPPVPVAGIGSQITAGLLMLAGIWTVRQFVSWSSPYATVGLVLIGAVLFFSAMTAFSHRFREKVITVLPNSVLGGYH